MVYGIFMSHTQLDTDFCDRFDKAVARVGIRAFRSEFEAIKPPAWRTIKNKIVGSRAVFLLVGRELQKAQALSDSSIEAREKWKYTQNWIAYEVGLACMKGIDVWVICDKLEINFPVPYLNNYSLGLHSDKTEIGYIRWVLEEYSRGRTFPLGRDKRNIFCGYDNCKAEFNLHTPIPAKYPVVCPTCLGKFEFKEGFLV